VKLPTKLLMLFLTGATAKETINHTTNSAVNTLNPTTSQAVESVNQATEKAKIPLEDSIHKAGNMSEVASNAIQSAINGTVKDWIDSHPVVFRLVSHPLISLAILLLFIFIILGLLQAVASFFARMVIYPAKPGKIYARGFECQL